MDGKEPNLEFGVMRQRKFVKDSKRSERGFKFEEGMNYDIWSTKRQLSFEWILSSTVNQERDWKNNNLQKRKKNRYRRSIWGSKAKVDAHDNG